MSLFRSCVFACVVSLSPAHAEHMPVDLMLFQTVPARDGTALSATVWRPAGAERHPTVLVVTPYVSDEAHERARAYVDRGYAMVSLDVRGRGNSEGMRRIFAETGLDGCDAVAWIKDQPWSDGRVAMRGGSYRGMTQWMTARACPEALETFIPTASTYPGEDAPVALGRGLSAFQLRWLSYVAGRTRNSQIFGDTDHWRRVFVDLYKRHVPFHLWDKAAGTPAPVFKTWIDKSADSALLEDETWRPEHYRPMKMPILTITGHFDGDQPGALRFFREHQAHAKGRARRDHYLVMGPWDHGDTRAPTRELGGELGGSVEPHHVFPENSVFDMDAFNLDWFDWHMKGGDRPALLTDRVVYYVGGVGEWRSAPSLDAVADGVRRYYLSANPDEGRDVFHSGRLINNAPDDEEPTAFVSDPLDLSGLDVSGGRSRGIIIGTLKYRGAAHMPEARVFHSAPFAEPVTLAGQMRLTLHLSMDAPDADVIATVAAILPDGEHRLLGEDVVRARFRNGSEPEPASPGVVEPYVFDDFYWTAWVLPKGARLRLTVGPFQDPYAQKNYNSGGRIGYETIEDARIATIQIHHDAGHPSVLELPVVR